MRWKTTADVRTKILSDRNKSWRDAFKNRMAKTIGIKDWSQNSPRNDGTSEDWSSIIENPHASK